MGKKSDELQPKVVLAVGAHPDDIDFGMSGSIAKWVKAGAEVHYLLLTDGSKGSADDAMTSKKLTALRRQEQNKAAAILGVKKVHYLNYPDGYLQITMGLKRDIARVIRRVRPDVVLTMDPTMVYSTEVGFINHPDHRAAGQATLDAVFPLARDRLSFPELLKEGLQPHITPVILLINFEKHNFYVDISDTIELKLEALRQHVSQNAHIESTQQRIRDRAANMAALHPTATYVEAFIRLDIQP